MESKKILLISTGDTNGAYEAIYRLSCCLVKEGHQVAMLVKFKQKKDYFIREFYTKKPFILSYIFEKIKYRLINYFFFNSKYNFLSRNESNRNILAEDIVGQVGFIPDYIFTGMTNGFVNSTDLVNIYKHTNAQLYNLTVDMNHFTGGCHYAWDCQGYIVGCAKDCPAVKGLYYKNRVQQNFKIKQSNVKEGNIKLIAMSGWVLKQSYESKIYRHLKDIHNVNSMIDTNIFNNKNKFTDAKKYFDLDPDKFYILTGCQNSKDSRKGFEYLIKTLRMLEKKCSIEQQKKIVILIVSRQISKSFNQISFSKKYQEYINDYKKLSLLYQAVDLFINSSIEDSGPMMVSEALACGTPVVGFDMGVINNMVISGYNGYKAILKDCDDLSKGIKMILELSHQEYKLYSDNSVKQVQEYSSFEYVSKELRTILK